MTNVSYILKTLQDATADLVIAEVNLEQAHKRQRVALKAYLAELELKEKE